MTATYEADVVAWANEQARLIRAGRFDLLDIEHIAEEIEDVGKSEQRELSNRMAVLLAHLLKWQYQPERQGNSWRLTIRVQRNGVERALAATPSLRAKLPDAAWWQSVWDDALGIAASETGLGEDFPKICPWSMEAEILNSDWLPASAVAPQTLSG